MSGLDTSRTCTRDHPKSPKATLAVRPGNKVSRYASVLAYNISNWGSSMVTSSLTDAQLFWKKSFPEGRYELTLEAQPLLWLRHGEYWSAESQARLGEHAWLFRRPGSAPGQTEIVEGEIPAPLASYKSHWGGGTLTFSDGNRYLLSCTGVWHHLWTLLDSTGDVVLRVDPKARKVVVSHGQALLKSGEDRDRLLLLVVFVWHEILQARDEAEMVAAMSATS